MEGSAVRRGRFLVTDSPSKPHSPGPEERQAKTNSPLPPQSVLQTAFHGAVVDSLKALQSHNAPQSPAKVPLQVFHTFQRTLEVQFSALMQTHREVMLALLRQDAVREEQTLLLVRENEGLVREIADFSKDAGK